MRGLALLLLALAGCTSGEEKACAHAADLWQGQPPPPSEPIMGRSKEECLGRLDRLKSGRKDCVVLCYQQATSAGALLDCEQVKCALTAAEVR